MKLIFPLVLLTLLFAVSISAVFSAAWKVEKLNELLTSGGPLLKFDSKNFERFTEGPRNFSLLIIFTALTGNQNCEACRLIQPEFEAAAHSWAALNLQSRLYFVVLDYGTGQEAFAKMKLSSAPMILHFPPNEGELAKPENKKDPMRYDKYDIQKNGDSAEDILIYTGTIVHTSIPLKKPFEYGKVFLLIVIIIVGAAIVKTIASSVKKVTGNPLLWAFFCLCFTLLMISGNMWNLIRGAPYLGRDEIISSSFGSQFVLETRIVATLYGAGALCLVGLVRHIPTIQNASQQRMLIYVYSLTFFFSVSLLIMVFRIKNRGYPFKLIF